VAAELAGMRKEVAYQLLGLLKVRNGYLKHPAE